MPPGGRLRRPPGARDLPNLCPLAERHHDAAAQAQWIAGGPAHVDLQPRLRAAGVHPVDRRAERSGRGSGRTDTLDVEVHGDGGVVTENPTAEVSVPNSGSGCSTTGAAGVGLLSGVVALLGLAIRRREG